MLLQDLLNNLPKTNTHLYEDFENSLKEVHELTIKINESKKKSETTIKRNEIIDLYHLKDKPAEFIKDDPLGHIQLFKKNLIPCKIYLFSDILLLVYKGLIGNALVKIPTSTLTLNESPVVKGLNKDQTFSIKSDKIEYFLYSKEKQTKLDWCESINLLKKK
jgi:hypothetical protein